MAGVFINYRTGDGENQAVTVDEKLRAIFGDKRVFRDRRSMTGGTDFPPELRRKLAESTVLLVLIGHNWLTLKDDVGRRRLDVPDDYVRYEIENALGRGITVVPVLLNDAPLPRADQLPPSIAKLTQRQAMYLRVAQAEKDLESIADRVGDEVPIRKKRKDARGKGAGNNGGGGGNTFGRIRVGDIDESAVAFGGNAYKNGRAD